MKELEIQYERPAFDSMKKIADSKDCEKLFRAVFNPKTIDLKESFWVALLNRANRVLGVSMIGMGSVSGCTVNLIEIFQLAINTNSCAIVLCHNHPSGNVKPSQSDMALTQKIKDGCKLFEIVLLDHIILTRESYSSFVDDCIM
ncbi:MAG: JAB domain-containing protein [Flavobacteriales bacterium]|nr:JAB domain-containing protein [Flavobacteriales bacterium]